MAEPPQPQKQPQPSLLSLVGMVVDTARDNLHWGKGSESPPGAGNAAVRGEVWLRPAQLSFPWAGQCEEAPGPFAGRSALAVQPPGSQILPGQPLPLGQSKGDELWA